MNAKLEKRYQEYKRFRKQGLMIGEASAMLGMSRQTGSQYEKRYSEESLPKSIANLEKRLLEASESEKSTPSDFVKLADALSKLYAIERQSQ